MVYNSLQIFKSSTVSGISLYQYTNTGVHNNMEHRESYQESPHWTKAYYYFKYANEKSSLILVDLIA